MIEIPEAHVSEDRSAKCRWSSGAPFSSEAGPVVSGTSQALRRDPQDRNKPIIVSEFGGGAVFGRHGEANERWTEEYQENLYRHQLGMVEKIPNLAGMSPWVLMDFRSPLRMLPDVQDYHNRKGLISNRGQRKMAFYTLQTFYRKMSESGK